MTRHARGYGDPRTSSLATLRLLMRIADDAAARRQVSITPKKIRASDGTVLVREWHGTKHQVTVLERRILISRQALSFRVANRTNDHRQSLVGSAVLRPEVTQQGAKQ